MTARYSCSVATLTHIPAKEREWKGVSTERKNRKKKTCYNEGDSTKLSVWIDKTFWGFLCSSFLSVISHPISFSLPCHNVRHLTTQGYYYYLYVLATVWRGLLQLVEPIYSATTCCKITRALPMKNTPSLSLLQSSFSRFQVQCCTASNFGKNGRGLKCETPKSVQCLMSPYSNTAQSYVKAVRKKKVINAYQRSRLFNQLILFIITIENVWRSVWGIYMLILGFKGLKPWNNVHYLKYFCSWW